MDFYGINAKTNIKTDAETNLEIDNEVNGGTVALKADDAGGTSRYLLQGNPDGSVDIYYDGSIVAQTTVNGITGAVWG